MKVVINADDFGLTKGVSDGIIYAYKHGIVTSTTAMCNMPFVEYASELSKKYPGLGVGVHLTLTIGPSLTNNTSLTDEEGNFSKDNLVKTLDEKELYNEFKAQIEIFVKLFGKLPTHLDSHHHVHNKVEPANKAVRKLAKEYNLQVRSNNDKFEFITDFHNENATKQSLIEILNLNKNIEVMCHPAIVDLDLYRNSSYNLKRVVELDILCDKEIKQIIEENNIELVHY